MILDSHGFTRQFVILDRLFKPSGLIILLKMEKPGIIVDTVGELQKHHEILCAQVKLGFWSCEIKALSF